MLFSIIGVIALRGDMMNKKNIINKKKLIHFNKKILHAYICELILNFVHNIKINGTKVPFIK